MIRPDRAIAGLALAAVLESCATGAPQTGVTAVTAADIPEAVRAAALRSRPQMTIVEAELKLRKGRRYYDVEGRLPGGEEIELDLLETPQGWQVVEVQRDIPWSQAPADVRSAAHAAGARAPVRVIESRQTDGRIIYELFAAGRPLTPAMEVMVSGAEVRVLTEAWPH